MSGDWRTALIEYLELLERIVDIIEAPFNAVKTWLRERLNETNLSGEGKLAFEIIGSSCIDGFLNGLTQGWWAPMKAWIDAIVSFVKKIFGVHSPSTVFQEIGTNCIHGLIQGIKNTFADFKLAWTQKISDWWNNSVKPWFTKEKWLSILDGIKAAFEDAFKNAVNTAIRKVNSMIEKINQALNFSWCDFTFLGKQIWSGGSIQLATLPHIPHLATGGIVQSDALARIGENGQEAVLPLDRNTGWMQRLADMIGGGGNRDTVRLLTEQNMLLRAMLEKENGPVFAPSAEAGRWASRSMDLYALARG